MDPITLSLIGSAVGQGISAIGDARAAKREEEFYKGLQASGEQQAKALEKKRAGMYGMGPTMRKYMQYAMQDPTADLERQEALRQSGTAVETLKSGGARAILGGLGGQQQQAASTMAKIEADEYGRKTGALKSVGTMEERIRQEQRGDIGADLGAARQQASSGLQGAFMADQRRKAVGNQALAGLAEIGGQAAGAEFGTAKTGTAKIGTDSDTFNSLDFGGGLMNLQGSASTPYQLAEMERFRAAMRTAGFDAAGGKVKKTPGEFSHGSNPIDVMQDGAKIGELTGGEYVLNPEQAKKIANQSKYAKMLFRKFDKQQPA